MTGKRTDGARSGMTKGFRPHIPTVAVLAAAAAAYLYRHRRRAGAAVERSRRIQDVEDEEVYGVREPGTNLHACVGLYRVTPGTLDESLEKAHDALLPVMQKRPGLNRHIVVTTGPDMFASLGVWETRARAEKAATAISGWMAENMGNTVVWMEEHIGEVIAQCVPFPSDTSPRYGMIGVRTLTSIPPDLIETMHAAYLPQMERQPGVNEFVAIRTDEGSVITSAIYDFKVDAQRAAANLDPWMEEHVAPYATHVEHYAGVVAWAVRKS